MRVADAFAVRQDLPTTLSQLIVRRARIGLCIVTAGQLLFMLIERVSGGEPGGWNDALHGLALVLIAIFFVLLARPAAQLRPVPVALFGIGALCALRALGGIWGDDVAPTALTCVTVALVVGGTVPWGVGAQLAGAAMAGAAIGVNAYFVPGAGGDHPGRAAAIVVTALAGSVALAYELQHNHVRWFAEILERRRVQDDLAHLNAELERRVSDRTAALAAHQAELAHVLRLGTMGEMAASLAHEINQPLGAIANYAQGCVHRLRDGAEPAAVLPAVEEIGREALRAGEILRRVRTLVRKEELRSEPLDVRALVRDAARIVEPEARRQGVTVRLEGAAPLPRVYGDGIQIEQVVLNLLLNGLDAILANGAQGERELRVTTAAIDDAVEVAVCDTGVGIPPDDVFAPFFSTKPAGLGMGLSISRSIIEAHGGQLAAARNPDRGSTFRFTLPARRPD